MARKTATRNFRTENHYGLMTDKYELTMLEGFVKANVQDRKAVYELFARKLPEGRSYGIVGGTARAIEAILNFRFSETDLDYLADFLSPETLDYLADYAFSGTVIGYQEGDFWFPYSPLLTVRATLGEATIIETLLLSIFNADSAVASAAAHMVQVADGKPLMEFGTRRINEQAAVNAARMAYIAGFTATSNLEAGRQHKVPVFGTSAHAFTLAFQDEKEAFEAQVAVLGKNTTLLVDTYDIEEGIRNALAVCGTELGSIRIDSGDPFEVIPAARKQLDDAGAVNTKIVLSGDVTLESLKTFEDASLAIDSYGVGTSVVTGNGAVAAGFVYKLVSVEDKNGNMVNVAKKSNGGKKSIGGAKTAYREYGNDWEVVAEHLVTDNSGTLISSDWDRVQTVYIQGGKLMSLPKVEEARNLVSRNLTETKVDNEVETYIDDEVVWKLNV